MDLTRFESDKAWLRESYVGNECDTDEYGETQPVKGLTMIADLASALENDRDRVNALMVQVSEWTRAWDGSRYGGAEELMPLYGQYFDVLWDRGRHPYYTSEAEIDEWITDVRSEGY
jgi:hypothetical protein